MMAGLPKGGPGKSGGGREVSVPLASLSQDDGEGNMADPAEGDAVDFQVAGKVVGIQGEMAQVMVESINGQPLGEAKPEAEEPSEEESLMAKAKSEDEEAFGEAV